MSSWGKYDNAANAPYWAVNSALTTVDAQPVGTRPTAANVALLYGNTTFGVYNTSETIGLFGMDDSEVANTQQKGVSHAGWVLRTVGQGGRAGRTQHETLVVLSTITGDGDTTTIANTANP